MTRAHFCLKPASLLCLGLLLAWAQASQAQPLDSALATAPARTEFVLVIDDLRAFRATRSGESWSALLTTLYPRDGDGRKAWRELAAMLGQNEEQSFDALFGSRVTFLCASIWDDANEPQWLVVSRVARGFDRVLLRALDAAPREIVKNVPIFALEQGRYFVATQSQGKGRELLVCPRESLPLLLDYVQQRETLEYERESVRALGARDALLWVKGDAQDPWWGAGAVSFLNEHTAIDAVLRFEQAQPVSEPWDVAPWLAGDEDEIARVIERADGDLPFKPVMSIAPALEQLAQEADAMPTRSLLSIRRQSDDAIAVGLALEFPRAPELAFNLDRTTAGVLVWIGEKLHKPLPRHDFNGVYPDAARLVELDETLALPMLGPTPMMFAWKRLGMKDSRTWWGWGTTPGMLGELLPTPDTERGEQPVRVLRDWVTAGTARPRLLLHVMHNAGVPIPARIRPVTLLEEIRWWVWLEDSRTARGMIVLDLLAPGAQLP